MIKYVIKNCSCYNKDYSCQSKDNITGKYCKDITDCVLKRIVEKCKIETKPIQVYHATGDLPFVQTALNRKGADFAVKIIELLEIEEVE